MIGKPKGGGATAASSINVEAQDDDADKSQMK